MFFERDGREPIDKATRDECYHKFGGHCAYCGILLKKKGWHADHVIPWAKGGPDDIMNLFPACKDCNTLKNDSHLETFRRTIETYHEKCGVAVASRFGSVQVIGPITVVFWFEKQGYQFPYDLIKAMMGINEG